MSQELVASWFLDALANEGVRSRYWAKVVRTSDGTCWHWTGAISGKGHGRFWVAEGRVVIAHRFGFALAHLGEALPPVIAHECDNPLCQSPLPGHLTASTHAANRADWAARRHTLGGPLRDVRGSGGRAVALRAAVREGLATDVVSQEGVRPVDRDQPPLW